VRGGREPDHDDSSVRVTEAGHTTAPILVITKARPLLGRHPLAPLDEAGAGSTSRDLVTEAK
jgi:hypothetical protein